MSIALKKGHLMKLRLFVTCLLFVLGGVAVYANSQSFVYEGEEVNKKDAQGRKQGKWVILGKMKNLPGYAPEEKIEEGEYKDNRKMGIWKKYYPGGQLKSEIEYKYNRPNGKYITYYPNGVIEEKGTWKGNKYVGEFERRYENGNVAQKKSFNQSGKTDGTVEYYHENGNPELVYTSKNGVETGEAKRFYPNGDVKEIINYSDGKVTNRQEKDRVNPAIDEKEEEGSGGEAQGEKNAAEGGQDAKALRDGYHKTYNENQDLLQDGEFKNGKLWNGKWYKYDENGLLYKIEIWKNGKYYGDGVLEF